MSAETTDAAAPETVVCPDCDGAGELWQCVNDGKAGCSHTNDRQWTCSRCDGFGEVAPYEPGDDVCGLCGMRRPERGHTACRECAG